MAEQPSPLALAAIRWRSTYSRRDAPARRPSAAIAGVDSWS
jgi:hypothetical protein